MLNAYSQSTIKTLHSCFPHTCWVRQVLTLAINNVAQKEEATLEFVEDFAGARCTRLPVDCMWCLVPSFPGLSVNSDNLSLSYVILFLYTLLCHYMHETWSWHAYRYALGFLWKNKCDTLLIGGCRLTNLLELSLRSVIHCSLSSACHSRSARPLALSTSDCYKITRSPAVLQKQNNQEVIIHHKQLTTSAWLMVMMLVRKACMSSLSSNQSSYQGVWSQLIDRCGNLGLEVEDGGTCASDASGPPGARSIW
jgi:hypothetical protein